MNVEAFTVGAVVVGNGKRRLQLTDRDAYERYLAELPPGLCVEVAIEAEPQRRPRAQQVRYWYGVVLPAVLTAHPGTTKRQLTRDLLGECFGYERGVFDKWVPVKASLSWLTAAELTHLIEWTEQRGA